MEWKLKNCYGEVNCMVTTSYQLKFDSNWTRHMACRGGATWFGPSTRIISLYSVFIRYHSYSLSAFFLWKYPKLCGVITNLIPQDKIWHEKTDIIIGTFVQQTKIRNKICNYHLCHRKRIICQQVDLLWRARWCLMTKWSLVFGLTFLGLNDLLHLSGINS